MMKDTFHRPGAHILYMELPMKSGLLQAPTFAVPPGVKLDTTRPVRLWLADYPTAKLSWTGVPSDSELQNVPHHELNIQVPVVYEGQQFYHSVYALTDDDVAMLHYRDAQGAPAKLADFVGFADPGICSGYFSVGRRTESVLNVNGSLGSQINANSSELQGLFDHTLNLFGTQALLPSIPFYGKNPLNSVLLAMRATVSVKAAWEFKVEGITIPINAHEKVSELFPKSHFSAAVRAFWLQADIGMESDPAPAVMGAASTSILDMRYFLGTFMLKYGGAQVKLGIPSKPEKPFEWQDGRFIWMTVKVKPDIAQRQLPPGAILADDKAQIFCSYYPTATLNGEIGSFDKSIAKDNFPYHEFGVRLQVKLPSGVYHHVTYILVDDDVALLTGRDMLGTPKKMMSKIEFPDDYSDQQPGSTVHLRIERRGELVIDFTGRIGENRTASVPGMTDGVKDVSVFANQFPLYLNDSTSEGAPQYVEWSGSHNVLENRGIDGAEVKFGSSSFEPLADWLIDGVPVDAGFFRMDYGKADDLKSRPSVGTMTLGDSALSYWSSIYQSHYGGAPNPSPAADVVVV